MPLFIMFALIRSGIEPVSTVSIADALSIEPFSGKISLEKNSKNEDSAESTLHNETPIFFFRVYCFRNNFFFFLPPHISLVASYRN